MQKIVSSVLVFCLILFSTACSTQPVPSDTDSSYDTVQGTLQLERPASSSASYPPEQPAAGDTPALDNPAGSSAAPSSSSESSEQTSASENASSNASSSAVQAGANASGSEVRSVWFSYLEFEHLLTGQNKAGFTDQISAAFQKVSQTGFNTVFVQVRPYADALYPSSYFPWSHIITGTEGQDPGFDPLEIMVQKARGEGLRIEAWINPYRVRTSKKKPISGNSAAGKWLDQKSDAIIEFGEGVFLNPASEEAQQLIVNGVREIVQNYDVDGIHFDDYFYPTTSEDFDKGSYTAYQAAGGTLSLSNWRRENVNILIQKVYAAIKELDDGVLFGISPQGNNENNFNTQYIDVAKWVAKEGYVDYICPQIYFGFQNSTAPFARTVEEWNRMIKSDSIKLYIGMSPYKIGLEDSWAGDGAKEWIGTTDLLARMVKTARSQSHFGGFSMYRYDSLFSPKTTVQAQVKTELESLQKMFE